MYVCTRTDIYIYIYRYVYIYIYICANKGFVCQCYMCACTGVSACTVALSRMARRREEEEEQDSVRHDVTMAVQQKVPVPLQMKGENQTGR